MKRSSPVSVVDRDNHSHSMMAQCDVRAFGDTLGLFIHVPQSAILIEQHSSLKTVQVFDSEVLRTFARKWKNAKLMLEFILADKQKFRYSITELRIADSTIWLDINENVPRVASHQRADSQGLR